MAENLMYYNWRDSRGKIRSAMVEPRHEQQHIDAAEREYECEACDDEDVVICDGCNCCQSCCNCAPTDCDCDACLERRKLDEELYG